MAYGGNKAACERVVREHFGEHATIVRPGIIAGRWDYTGRLSYWPLRAVRGGRFIVPAPLERAVQFIDAADLAAFVVRALAQRTGGTYNAVGPRERFTIGELAGACVAAAAQCGVRAEPVAVAGDALMAAGVEPWTDIPMWLEEPPFAGMFSVSNRKIVDAGLAYRPPIDTMRALMDWLATPEAAAAARPGLSAEREAALLAAV
jgi:2'-hydroxyisoflavone reductase